MANSDCEPGTRPGLVAPEDVLLNKWQLQHGVFGFLGKTFAAVVEYVKQVWKKSFHHTNYEDIYEYCEGKQRDERKEEEFGVEGWLRCSFEIP